jgi:hypothetical protein
MITVKEKYIDKQQGKILDVLEKENMNKLVFAPIVVF